MADTAISSSVVIGVVAGASRGEPWYLPAHYRIKITIDHTKVDTADHSEFPVLITEDNLPAEFWTNVKADGTDIVVTSSDKLTKLKRELVAGSWDRAGHTMELYVKVPTLSHTVDTVLYLYYGNASGAETNNADTWNANFKAVYHMNDDPDTSHIKDSTSNGNDGTKEAANQPVEATGQVGKAQDYTPSDYIDCTQVDVIGAITLESVLKLDAVADSNYVLSHRVAATAGYSISISTADRKFTVLLSDGTYEYTASDSAIPLDTWTYIGFTADGTDWNFYKDESLDRTIVESKMPGTAATTLKLGNFNSPGATYGFDGKQCEVRISSTARSAGWMKTTFNNLMDVANFYSVGDEEAQVGRQIAMIRSSSVIIGELVSASSALAINRAASVIVGVVASATKKRGVTKTASVIIGVKVSFIFTLSRMLKVIPIEGSIYRLKSIAGRIYRMITKEGD